jgi:hypothetical protein
LTPWDIGQVTRSSAGKLVLQFGIDTRRGEHRTEFALDAKASQQAASELRAWFERHAPDHRYSWQIGDSVHYNQPWQIGDVLPWVTLAGSATLTRRDGVTTIHTASRSFSARHDDDFVLLGCAEVSDDDAVLQVTRRQVLLGNGMILGTRHGRSLQLGNGVTLAVDAGGSVAVDGLDVGRVVVVGDDARLQVDSPLPEITLVLALVVHQDPDA